MFCYRLEQNDVAQVTLVALDSCELQFSLDMIQTVISVLLVAIEVPRRWLA